MERTSIEELEILAGFCSKEKIDGYISSLWFDSLVSKYPLHFLLITEANPDRFQKHKLKAKELIKKSFNRVIDEILEQPLDHKKMEYLIAFYTKLD